MSCYFDFVKVKMPYGDEEICRVTFDEKGRVILYGLEDSERDEFEDDLYERAKQIPAVHHKVLDILTQDYAWSWQYRRVKWPDGSVKVGQVLFDYWGKPFKYNEIKSKRYHTKQYFQKAHSLPILSDADMVGRDPFTENN